MAEAVIFTD